MAAVSGRGRPSGPGPRAMSRTPEPAPGTAGQRRPAPWPSRSAGRGSRDDSVRAPRRAGGYVLFKRQSPPGVVMSSSSAGASCAGRREGTGCGLVWVSAGGSPLRGVCSVRPGAHTAWVRTEFAAWNPGFSDTAHVHAPGSFPRTRVRCHPRAPLQASWTEPLLLPRVRVFALISPQNL